MRRLSSPMVFPRKPMTALCQQSARAYTSIPLSHTATGSLRATTVLSGTTCTAHSMPSTTHAGVHVPLVSSSFPSRSARPADAFACRLGHTTAAPSLATVSIPSLRTPRVVRVPRLLFFGGDVVSVTALEALYERLSAISAFALFARAQQHQFTAGLGLPAGEDAESSELDKARMARFVADHLTVICPALPRGLTPEAAAAKYSRQYPVARFCAEHGLPVIPVDHPRSLAKSQLLNDILAHKGGRERSVTTAGVHDGDAPVTWAARGRPLSDFDLVVVVSFRYFLPKRLLRALPPVINLHPSLLPLYRGASPIFSTLLHNEVRGGVSVIQMRADQSGMDSGPILWQCPVPIELDTDIRTYFPLVTQIGAAGLCDLIFGERTVDALLREAAARDPLVSTVVEAMSAEHDARTSTFDPPSAPAAAGECGAGHATATARLPSERLLEVVGTNRREGRLRVVPSSPLRPRFGSEWCTLCRAPPHITQSAVQAAAHSHRESFQQNLLISEKQRDEKLGLKSPRSARDTTHNSKDPNSNRGGNAEKSHSKESQNKANTHAAAPSPDCQGPAKATGTSSSLYAKYALTEAVTTSMKCADVFPASVLNPTCDWPDSFSYSWKFAQVQEYATFDHFTEDPHHAPLMPKDAAVLRFSEHTDFEAFGVWRAFVGGQYFQPSVNAVLDKGCTPVRNQLVRRSVRRLLRKKTAKHQKKPTPHQPQSHREEARPRRAEDALCRDDDVSTAGHTSSAQAAQNTPFSRKSTPTCELCHPAIDTAMLAEAEAELRLTCTFTKAIHPDLISDALRQELDAVEAGTQGRFYRAPPPLFASVRRRGSDGQTAAETFTVTTTTASLDVSPEQHALVLLKCRRREASMVREGQRAAMLVNGTTTTEATSIGAHQQDHGEEVYDEGTEDVSAEAPYDFLPDVIHAPPPPPVEAGSAARRVHIPPGTAYFPESCEDIGAVKCRQGWLLWKEAHLRSSTQAQPVALLRKGLAMKTGLLYPGMFSEYLR